MPTLKDEKVEAGKITKDDVVKGRVAAVKIGTKFAEVRDADGSSRSPEALAVRRGHSGARRRSDGEAPPRFDYLVDDAVIHAVRLNVVHVRPGILASPDRHRVPRLVRRRVQSEHTSSAPWWTTLTSAVCTNAPESSTYS